MSLTITAALINASVVWTAGYIETIMRSEESIFINDNELIGFNLSKNLSYGIELVKNFSMSNISEEITVSKLNIKKINFLWDMFSLIKDIVIETQDRFKPIKLSDSIVVDETNGPVVIAVFRRRIKNIFAHGRSKFYYRARM